MGSNINDEVDNSGRFSNSLSDLSLVTTNCLIGGAESDHQMSSSQGSFENQWKQNDLDEEYNYVGFIKWFHTGFIKLDPPGNGSFLDWFHADYKLPAYKL